MNTHTNVVLVVVVVTLLSTAAGGEGTPSKQLAQKTVNGSADGSLKPSVLSPQTQPHKNNGTPKPTTPSNNSSAATATAASTVVSGGTNATNATTTVHQVVVPPPSTNNSTRNKTAGTPPSVNDTGEAPAAPAANKSKQPNNVVNSTKLKTSAQTVTTKGKNPTTKVTQPPLNLTTGRPPVTSSRKPPITSTTSTVLSIRSTTTSRPSTPPTTNTKPTTTTTVPMKVSTKAPTKAPTKAHMNEPTKELTKEPTQPATEDIPINPRVLIKTEDVEPQFTDITADSFHERQPAPKEDSGPSFPILFMLSIVAIVGGYFLYHNKSKIIGFIVEGRGPEVRTRERRSSPRYNRLKNLEEAMPGMRKHVA